MYQHLGAAPSLSSKIATRFQDELMEIDVGLCWGMEVCCRGSIPLVVILVSRLTTLAFDNICKLPTFFASLRLWPLAAAKGIDVKALPAQCCVCSIAMQPILESSSSTGPVKPAAVIRALPSTCGRHVCPSCSSQDVYQICKGSSMVGWWVVPRLWVGGHPRPRLLQTRSAAATAVSLALYHDGSSVVRTIIVTSCFIQPRGVLQLVGGAIRAYDFSARTCVRPRQHGTCSTVAKIKS